MQKNKNRKETKIKSIRDRISFFFINLIPFILINILLKTIVKWQEKIQLKRLMIRNDSSSTSNEPSIKYVFKKARKVKKKSQKR